MYVEVSFFSDVLNDWGSECYTYDCGSYRPQPGELLVVTTRRSREPKLVIARGTTRVALCSTRPIIGLAMPLDNQSRRIEFSYGYVTIPGMGLSPELPGDDEYPIEYEPSQEPSEGKPSSANVLLAGSAFLLLAVVTQGLLLGWFLGKF